MKIIILTYLLLCISLLSIAQSSQEDINSLFDLKVDSIEKKITLNNWGVDTSHLLHYSVKNISSDTLIYITNSCFYYNHYNLNIDTTYFDLNHTGSCYGNMPTHNTLPPNDEVHKSESIYSGNIRNIKKGNRNINLQIPIVKDDINRYRVDGRWIENIDLFFNYEGQTKITESTIENRSKRQIRKDKRKLK